MKLTIFIGIALIGIFVSTQVLAASRDVKTTFPQIKPMRVNGDRVYYSVKSELINEGKHEDVCVTFQALDFEGFEIEHTVLCGHVPLNGVRVLTDTGIMRLEDWKRINKWQRKD